MQTEDNKDLEHAAEDRTCKQAAHAEDRVEELSDEGAEDAGDGSDHKEGDRNNDDQSEQRNEEHLHNVRNDLLKELFHFNSKEHCHNDGNDRRGVAAGRQQDRDLEEGGVIRRCKDRTLKCGTQCFHTAQIDDSRIAHRAADGNADELVAAHLFGCRHTKDDGQEVEKACADCVQNDISSVRRAQQSEEACNCQQASDDANTGQNTQHRKECTGNQVNQCGTRRKLFVRRLLCQSFFAAEMTDLTHCVINSGHLIANDDLVLTTGLYYCCNAICCFQDICIRFTLILKLEAQTGNAVGDRDNV